MLFYPNISDCGVFLPIATKDDSTIFLSNSVNQALDLMPVKKCANFLYKLHPSTDHVCKAMDLLSQTLGRVSV